MGSQGTCGPAGSLSWVGPSLEQFGSRTGSALLLMLVGTPGLVSFSVLLYVGFLFPNPANPSPSSPSGFGFQPGSREYQMSFETCHCRVLLFVAPCMLLPLPSSSVPCPPHNGTAVLTSLFPLTPLSGMEFGPDAWARVELSWVVVLWDTF